MRSSGSCHWDGFDDGLMNNNDQFCEYGKARRLIWTREGPVPMNNYWYGMSIYNWLSRL